MQNPATRSWDWKRPWSHFRKNAALPAEHTGSPVEGAAPLPDAVDDPFGTPES